MKRKKLLSASFAVLLLVLLVSCSFVQPRRTIRILIPQHPWEKVSGRKLWYTLRWTDSDGLKTLHVTQDMRAVDIEVDPGRTTVVAAYPLGELSPFGTAVTPADNRKEVLLSQDEGFLTSLLIQRYHSTDITGNARRRARSLARRTSFAGMNASISRKTTITACTAASRVRRRNAAWTRRDV